MPASVDLSGLRRQIERLGKTQKAAEQAVKRARGTLARRIVVEARRDIQTEYTLPANRITAGLFTRNNGDAVELTGVARGVGLINFKGSGGTRRAPVRVQVKTAGAAVVYDNNYFRAKGLNGNRQIFERLPEKRRMVAGNYKGRLRNVIRSTYGPSVAQMLRRPGRSGRLADTAQTILRDEIDRLGR